MYVPVAASLSLAASARFVMTPQSSFNAAIALAALWGVVLSTYTAISRHREKKRRIKVEIGLGFGIYSDRAGPALVLVTAMNTGHRPVTLNSVGIELPDKRTSWDPHAQGTAKLPYELAEGKDCRFWFEAAPLAEALRDAGFSGKVKVVGFYRDALGATHKSKRLAFDVPAWLKDK